MAGSGCGGAGTAATAPTSGPESPPGAVVDAGSPPTTAAEVPPDPFLDPVTIATDAASTTKLCQDQLAKAEQLKQQLRSLKGQPVDKLSFDNTLGQLDNILIAANSAGSFPYLLAVSHPEASVREAAKACEPEVDRFLTSLYLDPDLASVVKAFAQSKPQLTPERQKFLDETLRDFRRGGLELNDADQAKLRKLNEEITQIGQDFMSAIGASRGTIEVPPTSLRGLSEGYIKSHPPNATGRVVISTDYPDYFPFVTYSTDRKSAKDLYVKFVNRGGIGNVRLLERLLKLRQQKATLLGYKTWADYAIEPRMAGNAKTVRAFLDELEASLKEPARLELEEFLDEHERLGNSRKETLYPSDRYYLEDRVRSRKYAFDSQKISAYLELSAVKKGLMDITARMYDLTYVKLDERTWHDDIEVYAVVSKGKRIGKFYLDLHPRPDKYKHAAMFGIRDGKRLADGRYQTPIAALVCNFPKPGTEPALMTHEDTVTFFHEFGHVLHQLLTQTELSTFAGTATARDFVETPSQMFEEWAWDREVLDIFAKHHQTGERIPDELFDAMTKARSFGRALATQRQLFLARLDFEYHARPAGFDTTKVLEEVQNRAGAFKYVKGTHFQSSFGHLISYDAGYYGYQWALSLSRDVLTRFRKDGLLNTQTAASWRDIVLSAGGSRDETAMLEEFLGRPPSQDAYKHYLRGEAGY